MAARSALRAKLVAMRADTIAWREGARNACSLGIVPINSSTGSARGAAGFSAPEALRLALAAYQRGEGAEAERLCRVALSLKSDYFDALYLSAVIAGQRGRPEEAAELLARAASVNPNVADVHYNRGVALGELGHQAEALQSYERAIALKADHI